MVFGCACRSVLLIFFSIMLTLVCIVIYLCVIAWFFLQRTDLRLLIYFLQTHWLWYALKFTSAILRSVFVDLFLSLQIHCQRFQYRSGILLASWLGYQTKSPSSDLGVMQIRFLMARRSYYFPFWNFIYGSWPLQRTSKVWTVKTRYVFQVCSRNGTWVLASGSYFAQQSKLAQRDRNFSYRLVINQLTPFDRFMI